MMRAKLRAHAEDQTVEVWSIRQRGAIKGTPRRYCTATEDESQSRNLSAEGWRKDAYFTKSGYFKIT